MDMVTILTANRKGADKLIQVEEKLPEEKPQETACCSMQETFC